MFNKLDELKCCIPIYEPDVICITETHFNNQILDAEIYIEGYKCFRQDRNFKLTRSKQDVSGGGGSVNIHKKCHIYYRGTIFQ